MKNIGSSLLKLAAAGIVWAGLSAPVQAWAPEGHEIIARIADYYLTPATREKLQEILGSYKLHEYEIASWPDIIRGNKEYEALYPRNGRWHYVDYDAAKRYNDDFKLEPPEDGDSIVTQLGRWKDVLSDGRVSTEKRLDALRFVVHFAGDMHQPMHCAYRYGDMGGNMIPVNSFKGKHYSFDADTPMDYAPSLHSIWDEALVNEAMEGLTPFAFAKQLRKEITPEQLKRWRHDDIPAWAVDSYWKARKLAYRWADRNKPVPFKWSRPGMDVTLDNYINARVPVVREQLQKAGVRLAHLLNEALDPDYRQAAEQAAKEKRSRSVEPDGVGDKSSVE